MRMYRRQATTAAELVNTLPERELASILARYGEEPAARRIARSITRERSRGPIATTGQLASIIEKVTRAGRARIHPATRSFQALRIAVNDELEGLEEFLRESVQRLNSGGRIAVLSFHSLEDRIVKRTLGGLSDSCICPRDLPVCACGRSNLVRLLSRRPVRPSAQEASDNPRSRSARLRAAERLEVES